MSTMAAGEKKIKHIDDSFPKASIVLVDIEGTTTSISFVKDTLFPYVRSNLEAYLKAHWNDADFQDDLLLLKEQAQQDQTDGVDGVIVIPDSSEDNIMDAVARNVLWQMDMDRKTKALKQLQGHIMREGYKNGTLKGHVYSDVVPAVKSWTHSGRQIYVYSSGSVEAQKLLFGHSEEGSLLELFTGHFYTSIGPKVESSSYTNIIKELDCSSEDVLFLTDVPREAKAAVEAGLKAVLVVREGNAPLTEEDEMNFPVIKSFQDFVFEASAKRKKMSSDDEPHVMVESPTNGASNSGRVKTVHKTEVANPESAGSGNVGSSSRECEMMDVSSNDPQAAAIKTDGTEGESQSTDIKMALEDGDTKESGKTELPADNSEVSKTECSPSEFKTDKEKESPKPSSKTAEENDSGKVSETADEKLKAAEVDVEVSKVETDIELNDTKTEHEEPTGGVQSTTGGRTAEDVGNTPANLQEGEEAVNTHDTAARSSSGSGCAPVGSEELKIGAGDAKTSSGDATAEICAGDTKANVDTEADSSHEETNIKGTRISDNTEVDVTSTGTGEKMGAGSNEVKNCTISNAGDAKGAEVIDTANVAIQMEAEVTGETETKSLANVGEKDEALRKAMDMTSEENANVKEKGENGKLSEDSAKIKDGDGVKLHSKVTDETEPDIALHQLPEKPSVNDLSVDNYAPGHKSVAEHSKFTAESDRELPATDASQDRSSSELNSDADNISQAAVENIQTTVKISDSDFPVAACNIDPAETDENTSKDNKPVESKNEARKEVGESRSVEDTTKENGLAATAANDKDDNIRTEHPDSEQNGQVNDAECDVKVKKLSVGDSGNKDDAAVTTGVANS